MRTIGSTIVGEAVDSAVFYPVAFLGVWSNELVLQVMVTNYAIKVLWEVVMTPVTYRVVNFLKRAESEDYFDRHTDFTPFSLRRARQSKSASRRRVGVVGEGARDLAGRGALEVELGQRVAPEEADAVRLVARARLAARGGRTARASCTCSRATAGARGATCRRPRGACAP